MKLFNLTFEESQSLVTEEELNKLKEKGSYKRFFGLLIASIGLYFFCVMIPTLLKVVTVAEDPYFTWLNLPLLIIFSAIYVLYMVYSIKYRHSPLRLKYCTQIYMFILTIITAICLELMMVSRRNF